MNPSSRSPASRSRRFPLVPVVAGVLVLGVLAGGAVWWKHRQAAADDGAWRTATVERGDIRVAISSTGTLSAISTVTVGSQISGQVTEVLVDYNDKVSKGQIVARIDPSTYQAQIEQGTAQINAARATLANAQATLRNAQLDYTRKAELGTKKLVAQSDVDLAKAALDRSQGAVTVEPAITQHGQVTPGFTQGTLKFLGVPVRTVDRLLRTEARVVA